MNKDLVIKKIRNNLKKKLPSIGTFAQTNSPEVLEILSSQGYEWIALDLEHGQINLNDLTNLFRAIEVNNCLPLVRLGDNSEYSCKKVMDAGAAGVIIPLTKNAKELKDIINYCIWPPKGKRGVGFSRANQYGKNFKNYSRNLSQNPLIIAMIENKEFVSNIDDIIKINTVDAFFIGPYDLSASLGRPGDFDSKIFKKTLQKILTVCKKNKKPLGIHIVNPNPKELKKKISTGYQFMAFSLDTVFLNISSKFPL